MSPSSLRWLLIDRVDLCLPYFPFSCVYLLLVVNSRLDVSVGVEAILIVLYLYVIEAIFLSFACLL